MIELMEIFFLYSVEWSGEALRIMAGLTAGQLLHAQVAGYDETGLPLVHLYLTLHPQVSYLVYWIVEIWHNNKIYNNFSIFVGHVNVTKSYKKN